MKSRTLLTFPAAILILAACGSTPQRPENLVRGDIESVKAYIGQLVRHEMQQNDIAGMSIALVDDQKVIWAEGFGAATLRCATPDNETEQCAIDGYVLKRVPN